jgi:hypothetical protein
MNKAGPRKAAYDKAYNARPEQKKRRAARGRSRYLMVKKHGKAAIAGKDIDHKDRNPSNMSGKNLRIQSPSKNRGRNK